MVTYETGTGQSGHLRNRNGSVRAESNLALRSTQEWLREEDSSAQDRDLVLSGWNVTHRISELVYR